MDFTLREDETAVAELARTILSDHSTNDRLKELEAAGEPYDQALWQALVEANLLGVAVPEEYGGMDLGFFALGLFLQEVGRTVARVPVFPSVALGALPLGRFGTDAQKSAWLPEVVSGKRVLTAALTELDTTDLLTPTTRVAGSGDGFSLTGLKSSVPAARQASHVLVPARFDDGRIGLFFVEPVAKGVTVTDQVTSDGQPHGQLELDGAQVATDARLGGDGDGADMLRWLVEHATAARCMMQLGVTERALEMTAEYSRDRIQFDRPIGSFQAVHQRAADAYINVEGIRLTAQEACWRLAQGLPASEHVAVAKYWAAEGGQYTAYACQHLHGGIGIDMDYPLHRHFIWATQIEHEMGSARHQLDRIGRELASGVLIPD